MGRMGVVGDLGILGILRGVLYSLLIVIPSERSDEGSSAVHKGNRVDSSAIAFGMTKRNLLCAFVCFIYCV